MTLSNTELTISLIIAFSIAGTLAFLLWKQRRIAREALIRQNFPEHGRSVLQLKLQAYERMMLMAERISIPRLINTMDLKDMSMQTAQLQMIQKIRAEFEYNITQQIYLATETWEVITKMKDQNILIINQIAHILPPDTNAIDFCRSMLDMMLKHPNSSLHGLVVETLNQDAKNMMK
jgi:hypothetical protein